VCGFDFTIVMRYETAMLVVLVGAIVSDFACACVFGSICVVFIFYCFNLLL